MPTTGPQPDKLEALASYRRCVDRLRSAWEGFLLKRTERLKPHPLIGEAPEKVAEDILQDMLTGVLDWPLDGFHHEVEHADIVLTENGIKRLVVEVKRPNSLAWNRRAVDKALAQAGEYAATQKVRCVAVSDGVMLYAADIAEGGLADRLFVSLAEGKAPLDLWWVSVQGIWRTRQACEGAQLRLLPEQPFEVQTGPQPEEAGEGLLHPKYKLPARCFAYVGDYANPHTWKLPHLLADGTVDARRLPKAIQAVLTDYRGEKVRGIPEGAIPAVLTRLAQAAAQTGHMSPQACNPAPIYRQLADALEQVRRATE
ncbi:MAG: hypothetical protein ACRD2B_15635 [Terriglobia bacterium]